MYLPAVLLREPRGRDGEGQHEVPGADLPGVVGVEGAENVPQHNISVTSQRRVHCNESGLVERSLNYLGKTFLTTSII